MTKYRIITTRNESFCVQRLDYSRTNLLFKRYYWNSLDFYPTLELAKKCIQKEIDYDNFTPKVIEEIEA